MCFQYHILHLFRNMQNRLIINSFSSTLFFLKNKNKYTWWTQGWIITNKHFLLPVIIIKSRRGYTQMLMWNQYTYAKTYKSKNGTTRWICSCANNCTAIVYAIGNNVTHSVGTHKHMPPKFYVSSGVYFPI